MLLDPQGRRITSWAEKKTMVPPQLAELYGKLMASKFNFMPAGERHLHDVHRAVKDRFPELCDDTVLCIQTCTEGTEGPEWQHRVRAALQAQKSSSGPVMKSKRHGFWTFNSGQIPYPDEVDAGTEYREGAVVRVSVNAYERNPAARRACIEHFGTSRCICGFSFGLVYGPEVEGFIHVHHLRALSDLAGEYVVDPVVDLRPVCPNCHAVLHSRSPAYTIEEVRGLLE